MDADESFLNQRSLIMDVMRQLDDLLNANKMEYEYLNILCISVTLNDLPLYLLHSTGTKGKEEKKPEVDLSEGVTDTSFVVFFRDIRKKSSRHFKKIQKSSNTNQITCMRQIDTSPKDRAEARRDREVVADSFRR